MNQNLFDLIKEQYNGNLPFFVKAKEIITNEVTSMVESLGIDYNCIESRIKDFDSLIHKFELKPNKYKSIDDVTDLVGVRIVTYYKSDIDKIVAKIISAFDIDWDNSVDKSKGYKVDQFGYLSVHYIVKIPSSLFYKEGFEKVNDIRCEIQIRTTLQHAWAAIFHDTGYKNDIEVPSDILRQFSRLAGLLELADEGFQNIRDSLADYRHRISSVVASGNYEDVELTRDSFDAFVNAGAFSQLTSKIASINCMEVQEGNLNLFLDLFKYFGFNTLKDLDVFIKDNSEDAYKLEVLQFNDTDIDIITTATAPLALAIVYNLKKGCGVYEIKNVLNILFGERRTNQKLAERLFGYGVTLGLVNEDKNGK